MNKVFYIIFAVLISQFGYSQYNKQWKGYFSYSEIKDLSQSSTTVYAASENALFSLNNLTNLLKTTNTIDGLAGEIISAIHHSSFYNKTIIGYENGLMLIISDSDGTILNVVDIINKQLPANIKKINHINEFNGILYISCDFGIVQYNLATSGFGDTYFIGTSGEEVVVNQSAVFNGKIYAATNQGIKVASVTNPNLNDFMQWQQIVPGIWNGVETFKTQLIAAENTGRLAKLQGNNFVTISQFPSIILDLRAAEDFLIVTTAGSISIYNINLAVAAQVNNYTMPQPYPLFTCATVINGAIYIGTRENGLLQTDIFNPTTYQNIEPTGPIRNSIFSVNAAGPDLWAVYGGYNEPYAPTQQYGYGISKYSNSTWKNIPYEEVHPPGKDVGDFVRVTVNPSNTNEIYVSSYHGGLLKFENDELVKLYDESNSGLESLVLAGVPTYKSIRIEETVFDKNGNLWMTNVAVEKPLKVLKANGQWVSYALAAINDPAFTNRFGRMRIDKNNVKWIATKMFGLVGFNEIGNISKKVSMGSDAGNLPDNDVRAIAIDNRNLLWIGTKKGLRTMPVDRFSSEGQMDTKAIIILEDGLAQELLYEQYITDIVVDGANNKWIATADSGVFLLSPNGQETILRFTKKNSPLPSDSVRDIDINQTTGEVFFVTDKGMVSYKGLATTSSGDLSDVIVYPNPVRPEFIGTVKITGLVDKATVKIADIGGNLVHEVVAEGGTIEWDTTAFGKYRVASGVYMIFISTQDGAETKVKKVMIIR
ncbi:type IX secretion system anionic LPS delivery protein PorZ [Flavobacterium ardleyense]|uniref:type IX secretion system anionic LPS delivery protein PorZ n=1 Tax=Flavobacterium ardleyense TaxID=2038737 RepID=UPI00298CF744|nr:two-component regulator propeller domain-containing protein [Flavobacterium ardleyense]